MSPVIVYSLSTLGLLASVHTAARGHMLLATVAVFTSVFGLWWSEQRRPRV